VNIVTIMLVPELCEVIGLFFGYFKVLGIVTRRTINYAILFHYYIIKERTKKECYYPLTATFS